MMVGCLAAERWNTLLTRQCYTAKEVAADGHVATDRYGHALIEEDVKASAAIRLVASAKCVLSRQLVAHKICFRRRIDLHIMPIILACYLFCFIDRSNIGK